jgi:hypothetical protein
MDEWRPWIHGVKKPETNFCSRLEQPQKKNLLQCAVWLALSLPQLVGLWFSPNSFGLRVTHLLFELYFNESISHMQGYKNHPNNARDRIGSFGALPKLCTF